MKMDNMSHLNMPVPGLSGVQSSSRSTTVLKNTCICCLAVNVPLVKLTNCKHVEFFEYILEVKLEYLATLVCYTCHGTLKEIYQFKRQVEDSLSHLNKQTKNLNRINTKLSKLAQANIEIFHTHNSQPLEKEVIRTNTEVKIEIELEEECSDPENDIPLSVIKEKGPKTPFFLNRNPDNDIPLWLISEKDKNPNTPFFSNVDPKNVPLPPRDPNISFFTNVDPKIVQLPPRDPNISLFTHMNPASIPLPVIQDKHNVRNVSFFTHMCLENVLLPDPNISFLSHRDLVTNDPLWVSTERNKDPDNSFLLHRAPENDVPLHGIVENNTDPNISYFSHRDPENVPLPVIKEKDKENNTDPNISYFSHRDPENVPLPVIKEKDKDPNTAYFLSKYQGTIKLVDINEEEMWEERRKEAAKEKYLNMPYKCESCILGFALELNFEKHMETRHTETSGSGTCAICKVCTSVAALKQHMKWHYRRVDCGVCGARYFTINCALSHYDKMHGTSPSYKCEECEYTTTYVRSLRKHRQKHKGKVTCDQCGKLFISNLTLKEHVKLYHNTSDRTYSCTMCPKVYRVPTVFQAHVRNAHGPRPPPRADRRVRCDLCNQSFCTKQALIKHLHTSRKHKKETDKKFACSECDLRFFTEGNLKRHFDGQHLENDQQKCEKCNKVYKTSIALRSHIKFVHDRPRDKICDHCGRGFKTKALLCVHIRTHTGERPLACAHCPATFAHPAARYTHIKLVHKKKKTVT